MDEADLNDSGKGSEDDPSTNKDKINAGKNDDEEKQTQEEKSLTESLSADKSIVIEGCELENTPEDTKQPKETEAIDEANLHYENGVCIYTEPESKCQFVWDEHKQEWVPRNSSSSFSDKDYEYDGNTYTYKDKETNVIYSWNVDKNEWEATDKKLDIDTRKPNEKKNEDEEMEKNEDEKKKPKEITKQDMSKGHYGFENDTYTYTDPTDDSKYIWDKEKNAWFPKVDDDFLAEYQMNYGFVDPNESKSEPETEKPEPPPPSDLNTLKRKAPQEPAWFEVGEESTKVYVSGLPLDITETEFVDVMQKCGLVMRDIDSGKMKIKIYLDPETSLPKGDALCTYIKKESVDLALNLLDGSDVRGHRITVERAKFTMKGGAYDPSLKPKKRRKKDKEKLKKIQEKLLDWRPDKMRGERSKHEKIIIVKNLFDPSMFNKDVKLILEYQQDLREECLKCGGVKKVIVYDRHPEGVAQINFKEVEAADACVQLLNGRWFGQRKITAETWDGKTKYKMTETDEQIKARLQKWEKFLETGETSKADENKIDGKLEETSEAEEKSEEKVENTGKSGSEEESKCEEKLDSSEVKSDSDEEEEKEAEEVKRDSDENTRSSVGSDYDTDEEAKTSQ